MTVLRNIFRRKLRAFLTISGITIGVFALVVMGSMAEKINLLVDGGVKYFGDKVTVASDASGGTFGAPLALSKMSEIDKLDGVAATSAEIMMLLDDSAGITMGTPPMIVGSDGRGDGYERFKITYSSGRAIKPGERGKAVVGADLVSKLDAKVGSTINLKGTDFEVVGIMDKTLTAPDTCVSVALADAQELYLAELPEMVRSQVNADQLASGFVVYPKAGVDPEALAVQINEQVAGVEASGPQAFKEQVTGATRILNAIVFGVALISLLVGGLSVVNTMTMSVFERTREIGIRKAVGASHGQVVGQFLTESAVIGALGGAAGLLLGWVFTIAANAAGNDAGTALFLLTSRLAAGAVLFALLLGVISGIYPSWHAARLKPVAALRFE